jgi:hypothetical protein
LAQRTQVGFWWLVDLGRVVVLVVGDKYYFIVSHSPLVVALDFSFRRSRRGAIIALAQ